MYKVKKLCVYGVAAMSLGLPTQAAFAQCGTASWYHEGSRTANGERYRPDGITAAHRTLPFGTRVQVRNQRTGRTVTVRINDRGPFIGGRIIDLSRGAQRVLGMDGLAPVCIAVLGRGEPRVASAEDREDRYVRRKARATRSVAALDDSRIERPRYRSESRSKQRYARAERRSRVAAMQGQQRFSAYRESEVRTVSRRALRAELREDRRMRLEAAAEARRERESDD
jgi:rare lipoprotein A